MIDDGYLRTSRLIKQLATDLETIATAQPGSEAHRKAITAYTATFAQLSRSAYTKQAPFPLPPDQELPG